ncbi:MULTISPECIES: NINE protein [Kamptonema]|uniref:NINE protein n=1 Tax=Kamptonema TaxID=1501433 RepID=UPI0001DAD646|nr:MULTISPECIES: NINE protein [Kamptonema]CBN57187.1 conserved hypothetical protein [Kamptonema sp. PCC 6506]
MKDKSVAILLTFFLGGIGIHKFYLGYNFAGVLYLLFCWTFIPAIISFFDFIGLVLMSDQAFQAKYNGGSLPGGGNSLRSAKDVTGALADLKKLYDMGAITAEEYEEKRQKLLKDL